MQFGWRIGLQDEPRHSRLEDEGVAGDKPQYDSLARAVSSVDFHALSAPAKERQRRFDGDRFPRAGKMLHALDGCPGNAINAAPHRFDFRKFGHGFGGCGLWTVDRGLWGK